MKKNYFIQWLATVLNSLMNMRNAVKLKFRSAVRHLDNIFVFRERRFIFRILINLLPKLIIIFAMIYHVAYLEYLAYIQDYADHEWWQIRYHIKSYLTGDGEMQYIPISQKAEWYDFYATVLKVVYTILGVSFFIPNILARAKFLYNKISNVTLLTIKKTEDNFFIQDPEKIKELVKYIREQFDVKSQVLEHFFFEETNTRASGIVKMVYNPAINEMTYIDKTMTDDDIIEITKETVTNRRLARELYLCYLVNNKNITMMNHVVKKRRNSISINEWRREKFAILKLSSNGISRLFERKLLKKIEELNCITGRINVPSAELAFMSAEEIINNVQDV